MQAITVAASDNCSLRIEQELSASEREWLVITADLLSAELERRKDDIARRWANVMIFGCECPEALDG
jgi:hypothetical protein